MIESLFSMQDKICVVTGGSRGLGAFMAQGFLESGAKRVYITARKAEACIKTAEELNQYGECVAIPGDVATSEGLQNLVQELIKHNKQFTAVPYTGGTHSIKSAGNGQGTAHNLKTKTWYLMNHIKPGPLPQ